MCGIAAAISKNHNYDLPNNLLKTIIAMEYRGYDSAGAIFFTPSSHHISHTTHSDDAASHATHPHSSLSYQSHDVSKAASSAIPDSSQSQKTAADNTYTKQQQNIESYDVTATITSHSSYSCNSSSIDGNYNISTYKTVAKTSELLTLYNLSSSNQKHFDTPHHQDQQNSVHSQNYIHHAAPQIGLAHTRWATHGAPALHNTHPIHHQGIYVIHNGIIDNHSILKAHLQQNSCQFHSDTDTEVIAASIYHNMLQSIQMHPKHIQLTPEFLTQYKRTAITKTQAAMRGRYSCVILFEDNPSELFAICEGLALIFAENQECLYIISDASALPSGEYDILQYEQGDIAQITLNERKFLQHKTTAKSKQSIRYTATGNIATTIQSDTHHMYHEILEQKHTLSDLIDRYANLDFTEMLKKDWSAYDAIHIIACGTSYHAGVYAKYHIEAACNKRVLVDTASEFLYRQPYLSDNTLYIFVSQSGETADTLAALCYVLAKNMPTLAIVNAEHSQIARKADTVIMLHAGKENAVASTKAFTAQILIFHLIAHNINKTRLNSNEAKASLHRMISQAINLENKIQQIAKVISQQSSIIFTGKLKSYANMLEACLKMQELSYIPSTPFMAGEFKHGPLALINSTSLIIFLAMTSDAISAEKTCSQIQEILSRGGKIILFCSEEVGQRATACISSQYSVQAESTPAQQCFDAQSNLNIIILPHTAQTLPHSYTLNDDMSDICAAIPLQLLAYHTALILNNDVDRPRNLAKSVTVE